MMKYGPFFHSQIQLMNTHSAAHVCNSGGIGGIVNLSLLFVRLSSWKDCVSSFERQRNTWALTRLERHQQRCKRIHYSEIHMLRKKWVFVTRHFF